MSVVAERPTREGPYRRYRATLLSTDRVRELSRLRVWRPVVDTAWNWALILAAWVFVTIYPTWWAVLLAIPVVGTRYYALFIIGHDGMHRRIFNRVRRNDLFTDLLILGPIGAITRINNRNHLEHHKHLATEADPDRHKHACFNKATRPRYLAFLSGLANLWPVVKHVFLRDDGRDHHEDHGADANIAARGASKPKYTFHDVVILLGWQAALIGGLTFGVAWWAFPLLWLVPVYVFVYLGDLVRSFLEHSHPEADDKADEHRLITYTSNPIERSLFAPMNMNYHVAHHLWPSIPYYNLPIADREIRGKPEAEGLVWRRSYLGYLLRYYFALPLPECRRGVA
ncbi:MAG: fatty acid desaturase family protein [Phycisphaerales bacterium]